MNKVSSFVIHLIAALTLIAAGYILLSATDYNREVPTEVVIAAKYGQDNCYASRCHQELRVSFEAANGVRIEREVDVYTFVKIPEGTPVVLQLDKHDLYPTNSESFFFLFLPFLFGICGTVYILVLLFITVVEFL